ncbi:MAG: glycosyltransferase family 2 protein [Bacillota bacterium]|nr:glycosyltransferase family 2 protein [Bacillota bacterium]
MPAYNEAKNLPRLLKEIRKTTSTLGFDFEYIIVDDGSIDDTREVVLGMTKANPEIRYIRLSRNFGKEIATTAGINKSRGVSCIIMDADLQHPPKYLRDFVAAWEKGAMVVVGVRTNSKHGNFVKRIGSKYFYKIINRISPTKMVPGSTDFRLIDRRVIDVFNQLNEHNRMTRGLIDWIGFERVDIPFEADNRANGQAGYNIPKLIQLALNSMVSLSLFPLKLAGYLGIAITLTSGLLGAIVFFSKFILKTPWGLSITGTGSLAIILVFLVGIILICLGLIALYIANIYQEVYGRPLYIIQEDTHDTD